MLGAGKLYFVCVGECSIMWDSKEWLRISPTNLYTKTMVCGIRTASMVGSVAVT